MIKTTMYFQAVLKRNISRTPYGSRKVYKKGTVVYDKIPLHLLDDYIANNYDFSITEGHGVQEYFEYEKDVKIQKVEIITKKKVTTYYHKPKNKNKKSKK